jgi:hypothetical protein
MNVPVSCAGSGPIIPSCPLFSPVCTCITRIYPARVPATRLPKSWWVSRKGDKTQLPVPLGIGS